MISAKIIADSIANDIRLVTMELCYPRFIHSEFMTHRMFSRNAASSRAIPIEKMIKQVEENPAMPIHWGKNQPGMQAREELGDFSTDLAKCYWKAASGSSIVSARFMTELDLHKQVVNRVLEPFQWIKVIVTATEWDNFFKLRDHEDAQPEMQFLAAEMRRVMDESTPTPLVAGEWHLPYVSQSSGNIEVDIKCSVARCARVSYNNHDNSYPNIEKDIALADKLLVAGHMSPMEHQASPMKSWNPIIKKTNGDEYLSLPNAWETGVTHVDQYNNLWSGNFRGFLQYRQLL